MPIIDANVQIGAERFQELSENARKVATLLRQSIAHAKALNTAGTPLTSQQKDALRTYIGTFVTETNDAVVAATEAWTSQDPL